ncbi:MAG: peroxiredoxin family protein [Myxococcota bacterium]
MKSWLAMGGIVSTLLVCAAGATALEVGDPAPDFALQGSDGKTYSLADYRGSTPVVLAWYPQAFTSGCTLECKSLTEDGHLVRAFGVPYFMASVDQSDRNVRFASQMKADFPLLSDPTKETARAYGVLHQERFALRTTFYIGSDGRILRIDRNVDPANAARDIAAALESLGFERKQSPSAGRGDGAAGAEPHS